MSDLENKLKQFTGSLINTRHPLNRAISYTQGVRYLAEKANAYWLVDFIVAHQHEPDLKQEDFQVWELTVQTSRDAKIEVKDGDLNLIRTCAITETDFPLKEITLWFTDNTILLPSEW